jgi:hypothetical protein
MLNSKLDGAKLSEVNTENKEDLSLLSASEWVKRSRKKEQLSESEKAKKQAELAAKRIEEEEEERLKYSSSDLRGLSVLHSTKDFATGQEVILTLADSDILEKDERGRVLGLVEGLKFLMPMHMLRFLIILYIKMEIFLRM